MSTNEAKIGKILLVDEEQHIADLLLYNLNAENYDVQIVGRAAEARLLDITAFDLVIADAMAQPYTGFDLLRDLKANPLTRHVPVVILSQSDNPDDIVTALDLGADDYVMKPFSLRELVARIRSVLRRRRATMQVKTDAAITIGPVRIDLVNRQVSVTGSPVSLTKTEYAILALLMRNKGAFYNRAQIYDEVWRDSTSPASERIVDTNISRLRKKLGDGARIIVNVTGRGYSASSVHQ